MINRLIKKIKHPTDCWEWTGAKTTAGYGQIQWEGKVQYAHRISYTFFRGEIPEGLVIDHLCRNRGCLNPLHLEVVTCRENILRGVGVASKNASKKKCLRGHPFVKGSFYIHTNGGRCCKKCLKIRAITYKS